ncbi:MAG: preprotein translocase subunit YajC [Clostridia bacterium]
MLQQILSANSYLPIILIGGFFVIMMVMTIVPQKKKQKQMQTMLDNLAVGDKVMTIGRMIGNVTFIDTEKKQVVINVGTEASATLVTIDRNAIGYIIDSVNKQSSNNDTASTKDESTNNISIEGDKKDDDLKM